MVTALLQGIPFGFSMSTPQSTTVSGYSNCKGGPAGEGDAGPGSWTLHNDESEGGGTPHALYGHDLLDQHVLRPPRAEGGSLRRRVRTASRMGLTWPDGVSLLKPDPKEGHALSADNDPSFTLGADNVAPIDVAAADATLAARGASTAIRSP